MEAFNTRRARFFKSTMFRRRFVSVFMSGAKRKEVYRKLDRRRNDLCGEVRRNGVSSLAKRKRLPMTRHFVSFSRRTSKSFAPLFGLISYCFTYEKRRGREWEPAGAERHRRSREGELAGASEAIEPARRKKTSLSNETERNIEAGAGIESANRFTLGEAILCQSLKGQVTTSLTLANVVILW